MKARSLRAVPAFAGLVLTLAAVLAGPRPALQARPGRDMAVAAPESVGVSSERLKRLDAGMQGLVTDGRSQAVDVASRRFSGEVRSA